MSRMIKLSPENIDEYVNEFKNELTSARLTDGKINFVKTIGTVNQRAKVYFSDRAWLKMQALIREFDKEVAWHGVAFRADDIKKNEYTIDDVLVYPQKVTGASVNMEPEEYAKWIEQNIDDERFCNIRMQGHSHVKMGITPSSVDLAHQEEILHQLSGSLFYIFMIWNKQGEKNIRIFDMAKNILFETEDIDVEVMQDGYGVNSFIQEAKSQVRDECYYKTTPPYLPGTSGCSKTSPYFGSVHKQNAKKKLDKQGQFAFDQRNYNPHYSRVY